MDRINRFLRFAGPVLLSALMAGCASFVAVRAMGFEISWLAVYAAAAASALLAQMGRRSSLWGVAATVVVAACIGLLAARGAGKIGALLADYRSTGSLDAQQLLGHISAGRSIALMAALLLGALFSAMLNQPSGTPFVLMLLLTAVICGMAMNESLSLWMAVPGLAAGVAVFGLSAARKREGLRPALLIPAVAVVLLALLIVPGERITWGPLEHAAAQIRSIVEDYTRFVQQRMAFTINEKGYDHAGMIGDNVVAMLGGPANPDKEAVMRVTTDGELLLRGTIKRSYTGYSWVDDQAKARYLYYDFTHRGVRSDVFGAEIAAKNAVFVPRNAAVEILDSGTSTLFVPSHMTGFEMGLEDAVYYNSAGEIFLTRDVQPGDRYELTALVPESNAALIAAASRAAGKTDALYDQALADYTALPDGIQAAVYALAVELTQASATDVEKALAIQNHLAQNYRYTLDGSYPEPGKDFVSWFLLESKEGYCSYFASAMAVMCRIAGMPARYVEGYYVPAGEGEQILTGKNAHAWVEVYLRGIGWTAFDPTARAYENQHGGGDETPDSNDSGADDTSGDTPPDGGEQSPDPSLPPEGENDPTPNPDGGQDEPTPTLDPGEDGSADEPESDDPQNNNNDNNEDLTRPPFEEPENNPDPDRDRSHWFWWLLLVLLAAAAIVLGILWAKKRLQATDPIAMGVAGRSGQAAILILYRGMLTLLAQAGLVPMPGETPQAFAARAAQALPNPYYEDFVADVVRSRYSGKTMTRQTLDTGRQAYTAFLSAMGRRERIRYHIRRLLQGIGDLENIP